MHPFFSNLENSLPTIAGAILAAFVAVLGLIIAKENKISEFRQAWIDALRQDISDFIAAVRVLAQDFQEFKRHSRPSERELQFQIETMALRQSSSSSLARIRLRINIDDSDAKLRALNLAFLEQTKVIQTHLANETPESLHMSLVASNKLHEFAAPILKYEWERVKKGELRYRIAIWLSTAILLALSGLLVYGYVHSPSSPAANNSFKPNPLRGCKAPAGFSGGSA